MDVRQNRIRPRRLDDDIAAADCAGLMTLARGPAEEARVVARRVGGIGDRPAKGAVSEDDDGRHLRSPHLLL